METYDAEEPIHDATGTGRGYAVAGGVANAIENCINEYYPGTEVYIEHAEGLSDCQKMLLMAKAGKSPVSTIGARHTATARLSH